MKKPETTQADEARIKLLQKRKEVLTKTHNWRQLVARAKSELQLVDRAPGSVRPLTQEEDDLILALSYQSFVSLYRIAIEGSNAELDLFREAQGQSRQQKDRLTWLCRQGVRNAFQKAAKAGRLKGEMLDSIFVVPCSQHVRLEDLTPARTRARTHKVREDEQGH